MTYEDQTPLTDLPVYIKPEVHELGSLMSFTLSGSANADETYGTPSINF